ncbi:MAG: hypothetical protein ACKV19_11560 [Verrucomicrobiales bacterium]
MSSSNDGWDREARGSTPPPAGDHDGFLHGCKVVFHWEWLAGAAMETNTF